LPCPIGLKYCLFLPLLCLWEAGPLVGCDTTLVIPTLTAIAKDIVLLRNFQHEENTYDIEEKKGVEEIERSIVQ